MFLPLLGVQAPTQQETLNLITEKKPAIVQVVEPTLEEKIRTNYYKCDESKFWIRADNAQCLAKQQQTTTTTQSTVKTPQNGSNGYDMYQCTWWVKQWKPSVGNWGDAKDWGYAAQAEGWTISDTPTVGAVAWSTRGYYGHVAIVIGVSGGEVAIKEGNYDFNGSVRTTIVPASSYRYIRE